MWAGSRLPWKARAWRRGVESQDPRVERVMREGAALAVPHVQPGPNCVLLPRQGKGKMRTYWLLGEKHNSII